MILYNKVHNNLIRMFLTLSILCLGGCSHVTDKALSPPSNTKWVHIEIKNPSPWTKPFPLGVRYISYKCMKKRISGFDGSVITEPSYNVIQVPLQQEKDDLWKGKVAMIGGGVCQWALSAVELGIEYIEATHLRKDLAPGTAVGATIAFDSDASRNGQFTLMEGDMHLSPKYYPFIIERKIGRVENTLSLFGKDDFLSLKASNLSKVVYSPVLDESKVTKFIGIEKKLKGVYPQIIHPDGSIAPERTLFPDFDKVDKMKLN